MARERTRGLTGWPRIAEHGDGGVRRGQHLGDGVRALLVGPVREHGGLRAGHALFIPARIDGDPFPAPAWAGPMRWMGTSQRQCGPVLPLRAHASSWQVSELVRRHFFARIREGREPERRGARAAAASRPHRASARFVLRRAARWRTSARRSSLPFISRLVMRSIPPQGIREKTNARGGRSSIISEYVRRSTRAV